MGFIFSARYAPDGNTVAVFWNRSPQESARGVWTISLEDASQSQIRLNENEGEWPIQWSSDGEWIYAAKHDSYFDNEVMMIPVRGGYVRTAVTLPFEGNVMVEQCDITPDEKRLVCSVGEAQSDVWLMENFDPEVQ